MFNSPGFLSGKRKYLIGLILLSSVAVVCVAFSMRNNDDFDIARREVLLRSIGHELLLQSGDSVSRVLPVETVGAQEYRISFENDFTFEPDSLVNTIQRLLAKDPLTGDYVVNVVNCANSSVTYGFAISANKKDDIVACKGRLQPTACYMINLTFKPTGVNTAKQAYLLGLPVVAFIGFIFLRSVRPGKTLPERQDANTTNDTGDGKTVNNNTFNLGSVLFDAKNRTLVINGSTTDLTETETRLLLIFASSPNEVIERSRLQKEIWEDEGVIVGRSLDMFISKLRKKLEADPNIKIAVVRAKGYKLEINA